LAHSIFGAVLGFSITARYLASIGD